MAKIEEKTSLHSKVRSALRDLAELGDNSVVRRIEAMLIRELGDVGPSCRPDGDFHCRPDHCFAGQTLTLDQSIDEFRADDRRRSVFLDPGENVIATLVDYYSGRLDSVEFRNLDDRIDFDALQSRAVEHVRGTLPVIQVNHTSATSNDEVIFLLRDLAARLEAGDITGGAGLLGSCTRTSTSVGSRWTNNGRTLETRYQEIEKCCSTKDPCCGNQTCSTKTVRDWWQVTWQDSGSSNPPPTPPPSYQNQPWNNQAPIFTDPNIGTITSDYGWRTVNGQLDFHPGVDIAAPAGTSVRSIHSGTVRVIDNGGTERGLHITSGSNLYVYWHVGPASGIKTGDTIRAGDTLGRLVDWPGQPGRAHLHHAHYSPTQQTDANAKDPFPPKLTEMEA